MYCCPSNLCCKACRENQDCRQAIQQASPNSLHSRHTPQQDVDLTRNYCTATEQQCPHAPSCATLTGSSKPMSPHPVDLKLALDKSALLSELALPCRLGFYNPPKICPALTSKRTAAGVPGLKPACRKTPQLMLDQHFVTLCSCCLVCLQLLIRPVVPERVGPRKNVGERQLA